MLCNVHCKFQIDNFTVHRPDETYFYHNVRARLEAQNKGKDGSEEKGKKNRGGVQHKNGVLEKSIGIIISPLALTTFSNEIITN